MLNRQLIFSVDAVTILCRSQISKKIKILLAGRGGSASLALTHTHEAVVAPSPGSRYVQSPLVAAFLSEIVPHDKSTGLIKHNSWRAICDLCLKACWQGARRTALYDAAETSLTVEREYGEMAIFRCHRRDFGSMANILDSPARGLHKEALNRSPHKLIELSHPKVKEQVVRETGCKGYRATYHVQNYYWWHSLANERSCGRSYCSRALAVTEVNVPPEARYVSIAAGRPSIRLPP